MNTNRHIFIAIKLLVDNWINFCTFFVLFSAPAADPHQADEAPVNEQPATNTPRLMSRPENYTLYEGEEALLSCKIHDIGKLLSLLLTWPWSSYIFPLVNGRCDVNLENTITVPTCEGPPGWLLNIYKFVWSFERVTNDGEREKDAWVDEKNSYSNRVSQFAFVSVNEAAVDVCITST